jgi:hypothetical protein
MTKERLIWRPNEIPLDQWERMSREDQIKWWKDHQEQDSQEQPPPKPHMKKAISLYDRGEITQTEFCTWVMKYAALEEIEEFVRVCPPELMSKLKEDLDQHGQDETKWPRTYYMASYAPWVTAEAIEESRRREQEQIWNGVRLLKAHLP